MQTQNGYVYMNNMVHDEAGSWRIYLHWKGRLTFEKKIRQAPSSVHEHNYTNIDVVLYFIEISLPTSSFVITI